MCWKECVVRNKNKSGIMKTVILLNKKIEVIDIPIPNCNESEVLVKNLYSSISVGSEITAREQSNASLMKLLKKKGIIEKGVKHIKKHGLSETLKGVRKEQRKNIINSLGYSSCGEVISTGKNITDISVGDIVACGGTKYASHSEYVVVPRNLVVKVPEDVHPRDASFATIGSIVLQAIRRANVGIGDKVAVVGLGLLGQIACQILHNSSCRLIGIDIDDDRVKKAGEYLEKGFSGNNVSQRVLDYTDNVGVDCVILFASTLSSKPINDAMKMCRKKGRIVIVGQVGLELERSDFYQKELDIVMSTSYGAGRYDRRYEEKGIDYPLPYVRWTENRNMEEFLQLLRTGKVDMSVLVWKTFVIDDAESAYDELRNKEIMCATFKYTKKILQVNNNEILRFSETKIDGLINVGLIGCSGFAKKVSLPNITKNPKYHLVALQSSSGLNARETAKKYKPDYYDTSYNKIFVDKKINLVFVTGKHNQHGVLVKKALQSGKHVFVEKPICIDEKELDKIEKLLSETELNLCVGWNRRVAPFVDSIKDYILKNGLLSHGIMANFRINSRFSEDSWMFDNEESGSLVIGECCHWIDLMSYIMQSSPRSVNAYALDANNIICNMKYKNGSIGSIMYSTFANKNYPKERFDIFGYKTNIYMDNWKELLIEGEKTIRENAKSKNRGWKNLIDEYAEFLLGNRECGNLPVNQSAIDSMRLTFRIFDKLHEVDDE